MKPSFDPNGQLLYICTYIYIYTHNISWGCQDPLTGRSMHFYEGKNPFLPFMIFQCLEDKEQPAKNGK